MRTPSAIETIILHKLLTTIALPLIELPATIARRSAPTGCSKWEQQDGSSRGSVHSSSTTTKANIETPSAARSEHRPALLRLRPTGPS